MKLLRFLLFCCIISSCDKTKVNVNSIGVFPSSYENPEITKSLDSIEVRATRFANSLDSGYVFTNRGIGMWFGMDDINGVWTTNAIRNFNRRPDSLGHLIFKALTAFTPGRDYLDVLIFSYPKLDLEITDSTGNSNVYHYNMIELE